MGGNDRPILPSEQRILDMFKVLEKFLDEHRITVKMTVTIEQLEKFKLSRAEVLQCRWNDKEEKFHLVLTTREYMVYTEFCAKMVGLTLLIDGSMLTYDNLTIDNSYLGTY